MANPTGKGGKKFVKGDPRIQLGGRPKKSVTWKEAEEALREALPRVLLMTKNELQQALSSNPSGAEMIAAKFLHEHVPQTVERFLGKVADVLTGAEGKPLYPAPVENPVDQEMKKHTMAVLLNIIKSTDTAQPNAG